MNTDHSCEGCGALQNKDDDFLKQWVDPCQAVFDWAAALDDALDPKVRGMMVENLVDAARGLAKEHIRLKDECNA